LKALTGLRLREQIYKARGLSLRPTAKPAAKAAEGSAEAKQG
jgi:hypothetical protein